MKAAASNVDIGAGGPFASFVIRDGKIIGRGVNRVTRDLDPTAHSEVVAIRSASRQVLDYRLTGAVLVSSCEPCPMCLAAALWARVSRVVFAADRHDAAQGGFDDLRFHTMFDTPRESWPMPVVGIPLDERTEPFLRWLARTDRVPY